MKRILISGATGLVGAALSRSLAAAGHTVVRLTRRPTDPRDKGWDPMEDVIDPTALDGVDAVINLAGESIASHRWSAEQKHRIRSSRIRGTRLLREEIERRTEPVSAFVSASAIGYYGDRGDEELDETSEPGSGFLPELCVAWEAESRTDATRCVSVRTGLVLSRDGGALQRMLLPSKLGLGGPIGGGRQWWSWITLDDIVGIYGHAALSSTASGPVNGTAPEPVRQRDFAKTLGEVLHRPSFMPLPKAAVKLALGEMGEHLLFDSARLRPARLRSDGYRWTHAELASALRAVV
jgi:uncharacterized protein (TIGR01777 family)